MINIDENKELIVSPCLNIREALKRMDRTAEGILFVVSDGQKLLGTLTDGDIRRALLENRKLTEEIDAIFNSKPFSFVQGSYTRAKLQQTFLEKRHKVIPIVSETHVLVGYEKWDALCDNSVPIKPPRQIDLPVVIMAGGKGTRMAPFTNVLPKPLIPIGEKTILEMIIDEFKRFGMREYFFTINFRAEMIRAYFEGIEKDYAVNYLKETDFWGTAGSLKLLPSNFASTFFVSNCDIIVKADYAEVLDFHRKSGAMITVLSSIQHHKIPYGVISFESGGVITGLEEKPEHSFCINTGVYVLDKKCLDYIPENRVFHMTHLMESLMKDGKKIVTYPVNENEYIDIGQWEEYREAVSILSTGIVNRESI